MQKNEQDLQESEVSFALIPQQSQVLSIASSHALQGSRELFYLNNVTSIALFSFNFHWKPLHA